ncbi:MAG: hypothetical protein ACJ763_11345 [Bdellovibrionia bacterium]
MQSIFHRVQFGILAALLTVFASPALALNTACMAGNQVMPINNQQVIAWKLNPGVRSGFLARANVEGVVLGIFPDHSGHNHFIIQIGPNPRTDVLEVVYSQDFGDLPPIQKGMQAHACGDFIKSTEQNGGFAPSPAGAIVHWVHLNSRGGSHENGYLILDNVMYGIGPDRGTGPGDRRRRH